MDKLGESCATCTAVDARPQWYALERAFTEIIETQWEEETGTFTVVLSPVTTREGHDDDYPTVICSACRAEWPMSDDVEEIETVVQA